MRHCVMFFFLLIQAQVASFNANRFCSSRCGTTVQSFIRVCGAIIDVSELRAVIDPST